jgi:hypothetical protein
MFLPRQVCGDREELEQGVQEPDHVHRLRVPKQYNRIKGITNPETLTERQEIL